MPANSMVCPSSVYAVILYMPVSPILLRFCGFRLTMRVTCLPGGTLASLRARVPRPRPCRGQGRDRFRSRIAAPFATSANEHVMTNLRRAGERTPDNPGRSRSPPSHGDDGCGGVVFWLGMPCAIFSHLRQDGGEPIGPSGFPAAIADTVESEHVAEPPRARHARSASSRAGTSRGRETGSSAT